MAAVATSNGAEAETLLAKLKTAEAETANLRDQFNVLQRLRPLRCTAPLAARLW